MKNGSFLMKSRMRFVVLLIICFATFADYYIFDIPAVLKSQIVSSFSSYGADASEFIYSMLYTVYAIPNMILPLIGGVLTDKLGDRSMGIIYTLIIMVGQLLFCFGVSIGNAYLAVFGRFFFGIGGESLNICMTTLIIKWFQGNELSFSQGLNISILRTASIANAFFSPALSSGYGLQTSIYFGFVICGISVLFAVFLFWLDKLYHPSDEHKNEENQASDESHSFMKIALSFPKLYWILCTMTVFFYITVLTFNTFLSGMIIEEWLPKSNSLEKNQEIAGELMSVTFIISSLLFPLVGVMIDKIGLRVYFLMLSAVLILISFVLFLHIYPLIPLVFLGVGYSLFGAIIWPSIAYMVEDNKLGVGYGIITSFQNGGMGVAPLFVALIKTKFESNKIVVYFFILMGVITFFLTFIFYYYDSKRTVSLNSNNQNLLIEELTKKNIHAKFKKEDEENQKMIHEKESEAETHV